MTTTASARRVRRQFTLFFLYTSFFVLPCNALAAGPFDDECPASFIRGDVNSDGSVNFLDGVALMAAFFEQGARRPDCNDVADVNDDENVNIADTFYIWDYALNPLAPEPVAPFPERGVDEQGHSDWEPCDGVDNDQDGKVDDSELCPFELMSYPSGPHEIHGVAEYLDRSIFTAGSIDTNSEVDMLVQRFNSSGQQLWARTIGEDELDVGRAIRVLDDGRVFALGHTRSFDVVESSYFLVELTLDGEVIEKRVYDFDTDTVVLRNEALTVARNAAGEFDGFLIVGETLGGPSFFDIHVLRLDVELNQLWTGVYGAFFGSSGYGAIQTSDLGFMVYGVGQSGVLIKLDSDGVVEAEDYVVSPVGLGEIFSVVELESGVYRILQGGGALPGEFPKLFQAEVSGGTFIYSEVWEYPSLDDDMPTSLLSLQDNVGDPDGYLLAGGGLITRVGEDGRITWSRRYPQSPLPSVTLDFTILDTIQSVDGGFICGGFYEVAPTLAPIVIDPVEVGYLLKTDQKGLLD